MTNRSVITLFAAILGLAGCAKKDGETVIGRDNTTMAPVVTWAANANILLNGKVIADSSQQSLFQDAVTDFIEALWSPDLLGYVSATASGGTGFFVGGRIDLQSGVLNPTNTSQMNIRADSKFLVGVWDEYTESSLATGEKLPAFYRGFSSASGYVQGNRAYLKFIEKRTDADGNEYVVGTVTLEGTFDSQVFYGSFSYDNARRWDGGSDTRAGDIGDFVLPTCQFFRCQ